ncbi:hypothetical protein NDU88_000095 [Pleurodeles waltl]|uniref:Uncharacterized protein n=1 Tax=Pleurodeles waltl TaxID=8319 RepID=A0AAV7TFN3_PLEWA|nr:hypothetical protein NDU88_000095 [Pleurodeles waltl]
MGSQGPIHRSGAMSIQRQAPLHVPVVGEPQEGSQTFKAQGPGSRDPRGKARLAAEAVSHATLRPRPGRQAELRFSYWRGRARV